MYNHIPTSLRAARKNLIWNLIIMEDIKEKCAKMPKKKSWFSSPFVVTFIFFFRERFYHSNEMTNEQHGKCYMRKHKKFYKIEGFHPISWLHICSKWNELFRSYGSFPLDRFPILHPICVSATTIIYLHINKKKYIKKLPYEWNIRNYPRIHIILFDHSFIAKILVLMSTRGAHHHYHDSVINQTSFTTFDVKYCYM